MLGSVYKGIVQKNQEDELLQLVREYFSSVQLDSTARYAECRLTDPSDKAGMLPTESPCFAKFLKPLSVGSLTERLRDVMEASRGANGAPVQ